LDWRFDDYQKVMDASSPHDENDKGGSEAAAGVPSQQRHADGDFSVFIQEISRGTLGF
jgi:hypothetical protein